MVIFHPEDCSVLQALAVLGKKWTVFILCELLADEEIYFSDLQNNLKNRYGETISSKVLSDTLTLLEKSDIVNRTVDNDRRVRYSLTEKGQDLEIVLAVLKGWGTKWGGSEFKKCRTFTCVHNAIPIFKIDDAKENCVFFEESEPSN